MKRPLCTFRSKLGVARTIPQSRIWLEGSRLTQAGFKVGDKFTLAKEAGRLTLTLGAVDDVRPRTVSGKGDKPIVDIVGDIVRDTFPRQMFVEVAFFAGRIVITKGEEGI